MPGSRSIESMAEVAKRGYCYFLSSRSHGGGTRMAAKEFAGVMTDHGKTYTPFKMGVLLSVYVAETDEQARAECNEGVFYFLRNCLKGHLRREGRSMTFGPGVPSQSLKSWEAFLNAPRSSGEMLGDAKDWEDLESKNSIMVGSPETVRKKLWEFIEDAQVGNLLIQFQFGNMKDELARKSMRLFAEQVAPVLRRDSAELFGKEFSILADMEPQKPAGVPA